MMLVRHDIQAEFVTELILVEDFVVQTGGDLRFRQLSRQRTLFRWQRPG